MILNNMHFSWKTSVFKKTVKVMDKDRRIKEWSGNIFLSIKIYICRENVDLFISFYRI